MCQNYSHAKEKVHKNDKKWKKIFLSFSAIKNTKTLLEVNNRFAALDILRLCLTFDVYALQVFDFTAYKCS